MQRPVYITKETRANMSRKEQDLVVFVRERKYTKEQIKRKLYIHTDSGYWKLRQKVYNKIGKQYRS